jgi:hypothetical protein
MEHGKLERSKLEHDKPEHNKLERKEKTGLRRANFDVDDQLYSRLNSIAKARKTTISNRLREYTKLGVTVDELTLRGEGEIIIRYKNGKERGLLF